MTSDLDIFRSANELIETISAEGDGYILALRFVQKGIVNLTHHTMTQPQNIGIRPSRRGNWGIGTQRLGHILLRGKYQHSDERLAAGDLEGEAVWLRIVKAVEELRQREPGDRAVH